MPRGPIVGSRELKTRLGQYLERVRRGEVVLVTDRGEPVAELRPLGRDDQDVALRRMAANGLVTLPKRSALAAFATIRPKTGTGAGAIGADRDERG